MRLSRITALLFAAPSAFVIAQEKTATPTAPVQMIVTVEARTAKTFRS